MDGFRSPAGGGGALTAASTRSGGGYSMTSLGKQQNAREKEKFFRASMGGEIIERSLEDTGNYLPDGSSQSTNILDNFSPEMLSTSETVTLINEILRRALNSKEMRRLLLRSEELLGLMKILFCNYGRETTSTMNEEEFMLEAFNHDGYSKRELYTVNKRGYQSTSVKGKYFESELKGRPTTGRDTTSKKSRGTGSLYGGYE